MPPIVAFQPPFSMLSRERRQPRQRRHLSAILNPRPVICPVNNESILYKLDFHTMATLYTLVISYLVNSSDPKLTKRLKHRNK